MRPLSPRQRRTKAMRRAKVTVTGYPALHDGQGRVSRRDAMGLMDEARSLRTKRALAAAATCLAHARTTDLLARNHGFRLPGTC